MPSVIAVPDDSRVQDMVVLAQNLDLTRADPDYYALELGNAVLGGGFYSTRLSIDLRKNAGLVYSVGSMLQAGRTRGAYLIEYACDPANVSKAADIAVHEIKAMQTAPATPTSWCGSRRCSSGRFRWGNPVSTRSRTDSLDGSISTCPSTSPPSRARRYVELGASDVQAAFAKWMRPDDMVRVSRARHRSSAGRARMTAAACAGTKNAGMRPPQRGATPR